MVQVIAGKKGKGKTKHLLDRANSAIRDSKGSIVYLDKSSKHMYELSNKIRLINVNEYPINSSEGFIGFICGIISQDHDLEMMFLDSFLKLACLEGEDISETVSILENIGERYHITFVLSVSMDADQMPENVQDKVIVSL
ncbi:MAG TPA: twitching motility protein PilT [Candidatus Hungatella pullicola]|nr:twitching motility protein PilT [Candidatus Hungatella pullicola]